MDFHLIIIRKKLCDDGIIVMRCSLLNIKYMLRITHIIMHFFNGSKRSYDRSNGYGIIAHDKSIQHGGIGTKSVHCDGIFMVVGSANR